MLNALLRQQNQKEVSERRPDILNFEKGKKFYK